MELDVINNLWDEQSQSMKDFGFVIKLDIHKLPPKLFQRARHNKHGKASVVHGALTITSKVK